MKDYELFEEMVRRLRDAELLTDDELFEHRKALASIRTKLYPSKGRGRPSTFPSRRLMAARIEAVRQLYEGRLSDKELYELVAAYSTRRSGLPVKPAGIREIDRKFSTDHDRRWLKRNLKRFQDRVPDLLPSIEELEKIQLGKIKI